MVRRQPSKLLRKHCEFESRLPLQNLITMSEQDYLEIEIKYKQETIEEIRKYRYTCLSTITDDEIAQLYREWSEITASANWLMHSPKVIESFIEWATTKPCDLIRDKREEI